MNFRTHIGSTIVMIFHVTIAYWVALASHRHRQYITWIPYMFETITKTSSFFWVEGGGRGETSDVAQTNFDDLVKIAKGHDGRNKKS